MFIEFMISQFIFISSWLDWAVIAMMAIILIFNTAALWTILTILLIMFMCREVFQMTVSLKRYIFTPENWIEGLMIVFGKKMFCNLLININKL